MATHKTLPKLHVAAIEGEVDDVKKLLASGSDVNEKDGQGYTALHYACGEGERRCAEALLEKGANVNAINAVCVYCTHVVWCLTLCDDGNMLY